MAHIGTHNPSVFNLAGSRQKPIIRVICGDTWKVTVNLYHPDDEQVPATPDNTQAEIVLAETQFDNPLWKGSWYTGLTPDAVRAGLCHIRIPGDVTKALRRGSYLFSVRVSDLLKTHFITEAEGSFLVEYAPTSDQHDIPYKHEQSEATSTTNSGNSSSSSSSSSSSAAGTVNKTEFEHVEALSDATLNQVSDKINEILTILKPR